MNKGDATNPVIIDLEEESSHSNSQVVEPENNTEEPSLYKKVKLSDVAAKKTSHKTAKSRNGASTMGVAHNNKKDDETNGGKTTQCSLELIIGRFLRGIRRS